MRIFGSNPSSFKLILEYGRDSFAEQPALLSGGQVRLTKALATLEFEFNSDESESAVLERFTQAKSRITFDRLEERVVLNLSQQRQPCQGIDVKLSIACMSPMLRSVQVVRASSTGWAPEALLTALFKHCDLSGVWKLRGAEGFGNFWCSCCEVRSWSSLANMNLSSCGLTVLHPAVSSLVTLRILRLSHNRLTSLPAEISALTALEVLAADHNQLTSIPALRCSSLRHLELEDNRLVRPVLDLRALSNLVSLQLYGNPLDYLPELSPATALRSLSLANVRIMADAAYSRWEVEVAPVPYISRAHKLAPLFKLTFRSSCQHPLLAGALGRIAEDRANCELMDREETAIQQLVLMALSEQPVVAEQACRTLGALAQLGLATARKVLAHDVVSTILSLLRSQRRASKLCGLTLLGSLAAASEAISAELLTPQLLPLLQACIQAEDREVRVAALTALANLAFCRDNKLKIRAAAELLSTLIELAEKPSADAAAPAATLACRGSPPDVVPATGRSADPRQSRPPPPPHDGTAPPTAQGADSVSPMSQTTETGPQTASPPPPTPTPALLPSAAVAAPAVVRMPSRATGGGSSGSGGAANVHSGTATSQRYSDTGGGGGGSGSLLSFFVGSPPGPSGSFMSYAGQGQGPVSAVQTAPVSIAGSVTVGSAAAVAGAASPYRSSQSTTGAASLPDGVLSPPQQQPRPPVHHSSAAAVTAVAAAARALPPVHISNTSSSIGSGGPLSPTSQTGAGDWGTGAAAAPSGLPPQIALAPPRAVPEPVARRDQLRLLAIKILSILGENEHVRRALGQPPIAGRGVRVLALDGGGMRGLALVQIMRHIERRTGRPLYELFDLVVGTSTGAIVAFGLGVFHFSLDQCEAIYTGLGHKVFNQRQATASPREELLAAAQAQVVAAASASSTSSSTSSSTGWRDSLIRVLRGTSTNLRVAVYGFKHDASTFEDLLREMCDVKKLGCVNNQLIDAAALGAPKVAAVATLVSCCPVTPFLFTSYELPPEVTAAAAAMRACASSSRHLIWQAVRASSAAPYYLDDFVCGDERYQDGAATANNPSILALQQARLLWPGVPLEALVSLGCGAAPPVRRERGAHAVLDTGAVLVDAATSPDRADEALATLLPLVPGAKYFRFQPNHESCSMELDDVNPQHWAALQAAVDEYCTAHVARIDELAELLLSGRGEDRDGVCGSGSGRGGGAQQGGGVAGEEVEPPFEVPLGVGPDGAPLPPVPRVRLGTRRYIVVVEAPRASPAHHTFSAAAAAAAAAATGGSGSGGDGHQLLLSPEQLVVEALARRPHTLRRCDLAATAADAALSAALVEAHMRRLEAQQQEQQQQQHHHHHHHHHQRQNAPGPRAHSTGSSAFLCEPIAAAADEVTEAKENARRVLSDLPRPTAPAGASAAAVAVSAAISGLVSPHRTSTTLSRTSGGGVRPWASGHSGRGWTPTTGSGVTSDGGGGGIMEVAGDVVAAEAEAAAAAAAAAAAETAELAPAVTVAEPPPPMAPVRAPESSSGPSSVADAAVEAAEAAGGAAAVTAASSAAAATASFFNYFIFRTTSTRGLSVGGAPASTATSAAASAAAAAAAPAAASEPVKSANQASGAAAGGGLSVAAAGHPSPQTDGSSLQPHSQNKTSGDAALPMPMPSAAATPAAAAAAAMDRRDGAAATAAAAAADASRPACDSDNGRGTATVEAAGPAGPHPEVQPAVLLAALLQDVQEKCGLLHLGLLPVYGSGSGRGDGEGGGDGNGARQGQGEEEDCGLVARWCEEVMAVVEPGPEADRILAELGYCDGGGGGGRSLASLFAAAKGAPLESSRCSSYRLLARQEVWHNGTALATLLLQVNRPAALLRPADFAVMAAQLSGLVVTAAAPLPPAVTTALLRAGAAAVICPNPPPLATAASTAAAQLPRVQAGAAGAAGTAAAAAAAAAAAGQRSCAVLPYSAAGGGDKIEGGRHPQPQSQPHQQTRQQMQRSLLSSSGSSSEAAAGALGMDDAVVGYFEGMVSELEEGATVLAAIAAADRQHPALRGRITFHHL